MHRLWKKSCNKIWDLRSALLYRLDSTQLDWTRCSSASLVGRCRSTFNFKVSSNSVSQHWHFCGQMTVVTPRTFTGASASINVDTHFGLAIKRQWVRLPISAQLLNKVQRQRGYHLLLCHRPWAWRLMAVISVRLSVCPDPDPESRTEGRGMLKIGRKEDRNMCDLCRAGL